MAVEGKLVNLHYELAQSGGRMKQKYWTRLTRRAGLYASLLILVALFCMSGAYILWCTNVINSIMHWVLSYREGSDFVSDWQNPVYTPVTKMYVYNYTNTAAFLRGEDKKLKVEELGPYSYREDQEKVEVQFHNDSTVSYREKRVYTFLPEESLGSEDDIVIGPNIPLISAISVVRDQGLPAQLGLRSALWALNVEKGAFDRMAARDYFFGYSDRLYDAAQAALKMTGSQLPKLGFLGSHNGVSDYEYTIHTGVDNYTLVDVVAKITGKPDLGAWDEPTCNRIDGVIGTIFYPEPVKARSRQHLYHVDLCRRIDLDFEKEIRVMGDIPAYRYTPPVEMFQNATDYPTNACFAKSSFGWWPSGVFLNGPCFSDSPMMVSYPRYYLGDPILRKMVDGIGEPDRKKHQFYIDIHPDLGIAVSVAIRFQANIMIRKAPLVGEYLDAFDDNIILPNFWFETIITGFNDYGRRKTWHATYTLRWVEECLKYSLPLLALVCFLLAGRRLLRCARCRTTQPDNSKKSVELAELRQPLTPGLTTFDPDSTQENREDPPTESLK